MCVCVCVFALHGWCCWGSTPVFFPLRADMGSGKLSPSGVINSSRGEGRWAQMLFFVSLNHKTESRENKASETLTSPTVVSVPCTFCPILSLLPGPCPPSVLSLLCSAPFFVYMFPCHPLPYLVYAFPGLTLLLSSSAAVTAQTAFHKKIPDSL